MEAMEWLNQSISGFAYVLPRIGAAFVVLPLLTSDTVPALVRNVLIASIALNVFALVAPTIDTGAISVARVPVLIVKEIFIGVLIGFTFGLMFWAIEMAGQIIDTKIGSTTAQIVDPIQGHQTSLTGSALSRFASWLFVASGGLLIFMDVLLTSYSVWPVAQMLPPLKVTGSDFLISRSKELLVLALMLAAPALDDANRSWVGIDESFCPAAQRVPAFHADQSGDFGLGDFSHARDRCRLHGRTPQ
jgi:type III secretion protein T